MTLNKVLKSIKKHPTWWEESAPGVYQFIMYPLHGFIEQCQYFHPKYCTITILLSKNDFFYELSPNDERYKIYKYIFEKTKKDRRYLHKKKEFGDKFKQFIKIGRHFEKNKDQMTNRQVWSSYQEFMMDQYINYTKYVVLPECVDTFTTYYLENLLRKEFSQLDSNDVKEVISIMSIPPYLSFMEKERINFLELCLVVYELVRRKKIIQLKDIHQKEFQKRISKLSQQYFWYCNTYANTKYLTEDYYFKELKREILSKKRKELKQELSALKNKVSHLKHRQSSFVKRYNFSRNLRLHFKIIRFLGRWIDDRKEHMLQANHYIEIYCQEISKRFNLDIWLVKYYLPQDIKNLIINNKKLSPKIARARRKLSAYVIEKKGKKAVATIYFGSQAKDIFKAIYSQEKYNVKSFEGLVSSAPIKQVVGRVQVVMDTHKDKFLKDSILVATMTRPDFIPYMRRAKAVITDEGGLTCHAAIVSRELGIPCIIGTKIATRALKSGDKIVMDLKKGIINKTK